MHRCGSQSTCMAQRCESQSACIMHGCESQSACIAHRCKSQSAYMAHKCGSQSACMAGHRAPAWRTDASHRPPAWRPGKGSILVKDTFQRRRCQKWSKISKTFSFNKRHEAHQIDQLNALNMKMHVPGGQKCFFNLQESKVVKTGQNWSAEFRSCHFVIGGRPGVGGGVRITHCIHSCYDMH